MRFRSFGRLLPATSVCIGHALWSTVALFLLCPSGKVQLWPGRHLRHSRSSLVSTATEPLGEAVDCSIGNESSGLILLTSTGLGTWGPGDVLLQNSNLTLALRDLVLRLPDSAWEGGDGSQRKDRASRRDPSTLADERYNEPDLYSGLEVVVLEDNCFLMESFWNEADPHFHIGSGIGLNHKLANMRTDVSVVEPFFGHGLYPGWCVNFASDRPGYLGSLGFDRQQVHHVSLFDRLAGTALKQAVLELQVTGTMPSPLHDLKADVSSAEAAAVRDLLASADVVVVNGGNPDFGKYVFTMFAADVMKPVAARVKAGSLIYVGQSAGSMVGSADMGLTYEPTPNVFRGADHEDTRGLGLVGRCAIRPHDTGELWDVAASMYGHLKNLTLIRLANGEGLHCAGAECHLVGVTGRMRASAFKGADDPHLQRLLDAFRPPPKSPVSLLSTRSR